ncbi:MAG: SDR family NAD(P)-dependent oxidoreductase [Anaerolineaceae bacterium]|nr:SDR family NAD(P)-dependent oxidoreductase [Anaerolineaceae bacterium]
MSDFYQQISNMSPKRLMLLAMELQSEIEALQQGQSEPIAVIGMGCRFPGGANSPEALWELLRDGVDAISEVPASRWDVDAYYDPDPDAPGKIATRWGGFIDDIDRFEPQIFGISPREALTMDPQQRVLLEVVWEALERAGYAPLSLNGSQTGVFVGACNGDYGQMLTAGDPTDWDMYLSTGNAHSVISGRVSYTLGLNGPAVSVDTACSSSLVATHLAIQSLRRGECQMALACGTNATLSPLTTIMLSKAGMMAPDGRCKAFDGAADGFVRSEGCGVVVLKRLTDALADGDPVLAVIRGSAANQDGRSNGLTAPNGPSQVAVIRAALADAQLEPGEVSYIETHGTGTSLGDPIEAQALGVAFGGGHSADNPLVIGSLKANMGHMEASAGVGGLIKTVLMLQHGEIPPQLHLNQPSPYIPWDELPLKMVKDQQPWETADGRRVAGVSSFGFSGTNAHILLEAAPAPEDIAAAAVERPEHILALSARNEAALVKLAEQFRDYLAQHPADSLADVAFTANTGRVLLTRRLTVSGTSAAAVENALTAYLMGEKSEQVSAGRAGSVGDIAFLFTGHGSHYVDMGRSLYATQPVYREAFDRCDAAFQPYLKGSLGAIVFAADGADGHLMDQMTYAQPVTFALQYALAQLWLAWGVKPTVMMGHSLGEYAAACIAGVFSLEDGVKLVAARGRLFDSLPETGSMVAVFGDEATVAAAVAPYADRVSVAAINGPSNIVISGASDGIQAVLDTLKAQKIKSRKLAVAQAAHSPLLAPILDEFEAIAETVTYHAPDITLVSGLTGQPVSDAEIGQARFWRQHLSQTVRFADAVNIVYDQGVRVFLEIGPNPTLLSMAQRALPETEGLWLPSLRENTADWTQMLSSLGQLFVAGVAVDWRAYDDGYARRKRVLPTYPFQRERYWVTPKAPKTTAAGSTSGAHPLIGQHLSSPSLEDAVFETQLSAQYPAFLSHHRIFDVVILPSPAYIEMVLTATGQVFGSDSFAIEHFAIDEALILPEEQSRPVQVILSPKTDSRAKFQIFSRVDSQWKRHASGSLIFDQSPAAAFALTPGDFQADSEGEISGDDYYGMVNELGLEFGTNFRGIHHLWYTRDAALADIRLPEALAYEARNYAMHPALLDSCFHVVGAPFMQESLDSAYLLIGIDYFRLYQSPGPRLWAYLELERPVDERPEIVTGSMWIVNMDGGLVAEAHGLQLKRAARAALLQGAQRSPDWLYDVTWQPKPHPQPYQPVLPMDFIPPLESLAELSVHALHDLAAEHHLSAYEQFTADLNAASTAYVIEALAALGVAFQPGQLIQPDDLPVAPHYRRLLARLLAILAEDGLVGWERGQWEVLQTPPMPPASEQMAQLIAAYPDYTAETEFLERCAPHLADVLRGQRDPLELLFPDGSLEITERLYRDAPFARVYNTVIERLIADATSQRPAGRRLRVLEIGAGTGSTTAYVLPSLPAEQTEYVFTDLSPVFLNRAEEAFGGYAALRTQLLDIEANPGAQGVLPGSVDVVIAANVLHATADIRESLAHVRQMLAPGGLLVLLEGTHPQRWVDLTFGLTEGWWRFADEAVRPDYPLLSQEGWLEVLAEAGFESAVAVPSSDAPGLLASQAVLVARAPQLVTGIDAVAPTATCLIFADATGVGDELAVQLAAVGERPLWVTPGDTYEQIGAGQWQIRPEHPDDFKRLWEATRLADGLPCRHVVYLWSLDMPDMLDASSVDVQTVQLANCGSALWLTQALVADTEAPPPALWLVTRGAVGDTLPSLAQSSLWGLGRVIALEHPHIWGGLVDIDLDVTGLLTEMLNPDGEDQVVWRDGLRRVARLTRSGKVTPQPIALRPDATYLITGALGGLGLNVARWMAEQGAGHLVLTSRTGLPDRAAWDTLPADSRGFAQVAAIREIEATGTTVQVVAVDVADEAAMTRLFEQFGQTMPPLRGIIHAAADQDSHAITDLDAERLAAMFRPKVAGTWVLHRLTQALELDFWVLYSSTTALWGSMQLAHYAAANAFLDGFAHYRQHLGLPAISINWGTWDVMRVASAVDQEFVLQTGLEQMPSEQALQIMGDFLGAHDRPQIAVAAVEWDRLKAIYESRRQRPFLELVSSQRQPARTAQSAAKASDLRERLAAASADKHRDILVEHVRLAAAHVLRIADAETIDIQQGLFDMGMDSLMSVELKSRLETDVEQSLPSTLTFNYPTVEELAEYLEQKLRPSELVTGTAEPTVEAAPEAAEALPDDMDDLSEDELADLLAKKLGYDS